MGAIDRLGQIARSVVCLRLAVYHSVEGSARSIIVPHWETEIDNFHLGETRNAIHPLPGGRLAARRARARARPGEGRPAGLQTRLRERLGQSSPRALRRERKDSRT